MRRRSFHWKSKPYWTMVLGSKPMSLGFLPHLVDGQLRRDLGELVPVPGLALVLVTDPGRQVRKLGLGEDVLVVPDVAGEDEVRKPELALAALLHELDQRRVVGGHVDVVLLDQGTEVEQETLEAVRSPPCRWARRCPGALPAAISSCRTSAAVVLGTISSLIVMPSLLPAL